MDTREISMTATEGGTSSAIAISTTSAQSAALPANATTVIVMPTVQCFFRQGLNPTALADGTDQVIPAGNMIRLLMTPGNKLAFVTASGTGTVYYTPGA